MTDYARLKDDMGADVVVRESSAVQIEGEDRGPWVWIFIEGGRASGPNDPNSGAAHLDPEQATAVRNALTEWLLSVA